MTDEKHSNDSAAFILGVENQRSIDSIRSRFEDWATSQKELNVELKHEMELVRKGQDKLDERFEKGIGITVKKIETKVDEIFLQIGRISRDNELRDEKIADIHAYAEDGIQTAINEAKEAKRPWERFSLAMAAFFVSALGISFLVWAIKGFPV